MMYLWAAPCTYTSSEHFHLEEGETMLARGNEFFF